MATKTRKRPERSVKVTEVPDLEVSVWTVRVTCASDIDLYDVSPAVSPFGPCWLVRKRPEAGQMPQSEPYEVHLDGDFGDTCTCKGAKYYGHCRHQDFIRALIQAGKLPQNAGICLKCQGSGAPPTLFGTDAECPRCGGSGEEPVN